MPGGRSGTRISARAVRDLTWFAIAAVAAIVALLTQIGADSRWLAALGQHIAAARTIPNGLPYAAASSAGWENAPVLGELVFHALYATLSDRGLVLAQVAAVVAAFVFLGRDMRAAGAGDAARGLVLIATLLAAAPALLVVHAQLFSLALFPLLALLLHSQTRASRRGESGSSFPSSHSGRTCTAPSLSESAYQTTYLLLHRMRQQPAVAVAVLVASVAALLATPALLGTAAYYHGVLTGEVAARGSGLWAPLSHHALWTRRHVPRRRNSAECCRAAGATCCVGACSARSVGGDRRSRRTGIPSGLRCSSPFRPRARFDSKRVATRRLERVVLLCACVLGVGAVAAAAREPVQTAAGSRAAAAHRGRLRRQTGARGPDQRRAIGTCRTKDLDRQSAGRLQHARSTRLPRLARRPRTR